MFIPHFITEFALTITFVSCFSCNPREAHFRSLPQGARFERYRGRKLREDNGPNDDAKRQDSDGELLVAHDNFLSTGLRFCFVVPAAESRARHGTFRKTNANTIPTKMREMEMTCDTVIPSRSWALSPRKLSTTPRRTP